MASPTHQAAAVIPTYNRKDILRQSLQSVFSQTVPMEVIVVDDGSTDGTEQMMADEFPTVRYKKLNGPNGPCLLRNIGSEMATAPILFPIDDDAVFSTRFVVEQTLKEFDHPRIAAVGIPFINVRIDNVVRQIAPDANRPYIVHAYVGASHAMRRDRFLQIGGYKKELFYMGEEGDVCLRLLQLGYVCRAGRSDPIHHHESPIRSNVRAAYYGRRNDILLTWQNAPISRLPKRIFRATAGGILFACRSGLFWTQMRGLLAGYGNMISRFSSRHPVDTKVFDLDRRLRRQDYVALSDVESQLNPIQPDDKARG